jgi:capsular exopolysaccharide synthesis family protein
LANNPAILESNLYLLVLLAGLASLILTVAIIFAFEYFSDAIKRPEELIRASDIPLLGTIAKHKSLSGQGRERLVVQALPGSRTAENYRMLGSKILLSRYTEKNPTGSGGTEEQDLQPPEQVSDSTSHPLRSILLSSIQTRDDISEIVANLAVVLAQTGQRVILIDAYLHRPTIGQRFNIVGDEEGLTAVIGGWVSKAKPIQVSWLPNLSILPSGPIPMNPFELLASNRMATLIHEMESHADIVLIAASPLLSFADSLILASRTDGVVIVVRSGTSSGDMVRDTVESLRSLNAHTIGAIFDYNRSTDVTSFLPKKIKGTEVAHRVNPNQNPITDFKSAKS